MVSCALLSKLLYCTEYIETIFGDHETISWAVMLEREHEISLKQIG